MKQVFECGIAGTSNDEVGDSLLATMSGITLPQTRDRRLPDDFTIEVPEREAMLNGAEKYQRLMVGLRERGYETLEWFENDKFCHCIRFRRPCSNP